MRYKFGNMAQQQGQAARQSIASTLTHLPGPCCLSSPALSRCCCKLAVCLMRNFPENTYATMLALSPPARRRRRAARQPLLSNRPGTDYPLLDCSKNSCHVSHGLHLAHLCGHRRARRRQPHALEQAGRRRGDGAEPSRGGGDGGAVDGDAEYGCGCGTARGRCSLRARGHPAGLAEG